MKTSTALFLLFIANIAFGQCPTGSVVLSTQADVEDFVANFPDCTRIDGNLTLGGSVFLTGDVPLDVSGLSNLNEVTGTLNIYTTSTLSDQDELTPGSLEGLENISSVRSLIVGLPAGSSLSGFPVAYESLAPLNGIEGQLDSLFFTGFATSEPLPPFSGIEGIGYYRHDYVRGIESTPAFPALTYMGDMTITGEFSGDDTLSTVVIPPLLTEIGTNPDSFNWPFGGIFIFGTGGLTEITGGESLTYIQAGSISNNFSLSDISAFDIVTEVGINGLSISSCQPGIFDSFGKLETVEADFPVEFDFALTEDCNEEIFESVDFGISSELADGAETSYELVITADQVNSISVSGNFTNLKSLDLNSALASEITGFSSLDSITGDLAIGAPGISQLPTFTDLVYIGGDFDMRLNFGNWQLENMVGLESLEVVAGELTLGGSGPSGASQFQSLDGLEGLTNVGALELRNLEALNDLSGLSNLESAADLALIDLEGLTTPPTFNSFEEFNQITIDATSLPSMPLFPAAVSVEGDISVIDNEFLTTVDGFDNLTLLNGELFVQGNPLLTTIALPDDMLFGGPLALNDNPLLQNCGLSASICNLVTQSFLTQIMNNGEGCTDQSEVLATCILGINESDASVPVTIAAAGKNLLIESREALGNVEIDLYSVEGKRLSSEIRHISSGETLLPMPRLSDGIYLISLHAGDLVFSEKFFIRAW